SQFATDDPARSSSDSSKLGSVWPGWILSPRPGTTLPVLTNGRNGSLPNRQWPGGGIGENAMQHRPLGSSGLLVSPVCLGTMTFGTPVGETDSIRLVHAAIDLGINFLDTANVYEGYARYLGSPGGVAEEIVGKALRDRRDKMILATKVGAPVGPGPQDRGLSPVHILRELDRGLRRLQTDCIDLYILHWPDRHVPLETTLSAMDTAVRQGKVRHFGASNHSAWQLCDM